MSRTKSWLPAMIILCLYGNDFKKFMKFSCYSGVEYWVKSPAWMKMSAAGKDDMLNAEWKSWVSDVARIFMDLYEGENDYDWA